MESACASPFMGRRQLRVQPGHARGRWTFGATIGTVGHGSGEDLRSTAEDGKKRAETRRSGGIAVDASVVVGRP
jgi:hypothetical protein